MQNVFEIVGKGKSHCFEPVSSAYWAMYYSLDITDTEKAWDFKVQLRGIRKSNPSVRWRFIAQYACK